MRFPGSFRLFCAVCLLAACCASLSAQSLTEKTSKVERLMKADGYNLQTTRSASVWTVHFTGKHLTDIKVVLAVSEEADSDLMVIFVTVAEKAHLPVTTDFMRKLLNENHELDRVKVGYDADGDLFVREDAALRITDEAEMKEVIDQVEKSADEVYGIVQPDLQ